MFSPFGTVLLQLWKTAASFPKTVLGLLAESSKAKYKMHLGTLFSAFHVLGEDTTVLQMWLTELGRIALRISACTALHPTQITSCCRAKQNNPVFTNLTLTIQLDFQWTLYHYCSINFLWKNAINWEIATWGLHKRSLHHICPYSTSADLYQGRRKCCREYISLFFCHGQNILHVLLYYPLVLCHSGSLLLKASSQTWVNGAF